MLKHLSLIFAPSAVRGQRFFSCRFLSFLVFWGLAPLWQASGLSYLPQVINYSVNEYKAGNQNWAVTQDKSGLLYFGNNRGLLQFDGIRWTLYPLPNRLPVRSVYAAPDGRLYVLRTRIFQAILLNDSFSASCYSKNTLRAIPLRNRLPLK